MALLPEWLSGETWDIVRNKFNDLINAFNGTSGGTAGQVLTKSTNTDFDFEWTDPASLGLEGGTTGQVLSKNSDNDNDFVWIDPIVLEEEDWTPIAVAVGFSGSPEWGNTKVGTIYLKGTVTTVSGSAAKAAELPSGSRPANDKYFVIYNVTAASTSLCIVKSNGDIEVKNMNGTNVSSGATLYLDSISFPTF